jgi:hypothetical protein
MGVLWGEGVDKWGVSPLMGVSLPLIWLKQPTLRIFPDFFIKILTILSLRIFPDFLVKNINYTLGLKIFPRFFC